MATTAIAKREQQILGAKKTLKARVDRLMPQIAASVPRHVQPDSMARFLFNALNANPDIVLKCTPESICDCLVRAASRGLEISDGVLGDCYLVPFKDEAVLIVSYKGIKKLVRNSGQGVVVMDHVRQGDQFQDLGPMSAPIHVKSQLPDRHTKPLVAAYSVMQFRNGLVLSKVMTIGELLAHRNQYVSARNYSSKDKAWHEENVAFPRMCEKSCVRQMASAGDLPLSADDRTMLATDDDYVSGTVEGRSIDTTQPAIAGPDPDVQQATIEPEELEAAIASCETPMACDDISSKLRNNYPGSAQDIYDAFAAKREVLMGGVVVDEEGQVT